MRFVGRKKFLFLIILSVLGIAAQAQIGAKVQQGAKIFGLWQNSQFGYQMTLMLNTDGSGEFDGEPIRFTTQANKLAITQTGATTTYIYTLQENSLTLSGGDLDNAVTFTRAGVVEQNTAAQSQPAANGAPQDSGLVGVWSGNGESIEFKSNGQCLYLGNTLQYEVVQGNILLKTAQGSATFAYTITGNQLKMMANGNTVTYQRGAGNTTATQPASSGGQVPQELVGKWCWTNVNSTNTGGSSSSECIVLNANGTYQYASERSMDTNTSSFYAGTSSQSNDQGTWWVQGDRIYYNSQTRGQGSYQLQKLNHPKTGDPMIVLNGEPYVTFYQKPRW